MKNREELLAMLLGEKKVFSAVTKLIFQEAENYCENPKELHYMIFGGSAYVTDKILIPGGWEMLECEMIIIPKAIYRKNKEPEFGHLKLSQAILSKFDRRNNWEECEKFNQ